MNEIYIIQTSVKPGIWDTIDVCYSSELSATDYAMSIMCASNKKISVRIKSLKLIE